MNHRVQLKKKNQRNTLVLAAMLVTVLILGIACLFAGSSNLSFVKPWRLWQGRERRPISASSGGSGCPGCWRPSSPVQACRFPA